MRAVHGAMREVEGGQVTQGLVNSIKHFGLCLKGTDMIKFAVLNIIWLWRTGVGKEWVQEDPLQWSQGNGVAWTAMVAMKMERSGLIFIDEVDGTKISPTFLGSADGKILIPFSRWGTLNS